jgi:RimJ/RimL family protein N-acetyltransferase
MQTRIASAQDLDALFRFLECRTDTSLFLLENLRNLGLSEGLPSYALSLGGDDAIVGVVSVTAGGIGLIQAPEGAQALTSLAARAANVSLRGLIGPTDQVTTALDSPDLHGADALMHSDERIYDLDLRTFDRPTDGQVRLSTASDVDEIARFRHAYVIEALSAPDTAETQAATRAEAERMSVDGVTFVLVQDARVVAMTTFSARHGDVVQVGGVFTPPELRRRGLGRAVVAGSLRHAKREWNAQQAVLFTAERNTPAQRAYEALGFVRRGGFTLHFFRKPVDLSQARS